MNTIAISILYYIGKTLSEKQDFKMFDYTSILPTYSLIYVIILYLF